MSERKSRSVPQESRQVYRNLPPEKLQQMAILRGEGQETADGVLAVTTEPKGRSPHGSGIVENQMAVDLGINFGGINRRVTNEDFEGLLARAETQLLQGDEFVLDGYLRTGVETVAPITVRTPNAWMAQYLGNLYVRQEQVDRYGFKPDPDIKFKLIDAPDIDANIEVGGAMTDTAIVARLNENGEHEIVAAKTKYGGERKKKPYTLLQALLPNRGVATLHASAVGRTVIAGLSGTGKTTLSNDPNRELIGDDEHGIDFRPDTGRKQGVFNLEGGSYAKMIGIKQHKEPDIYRAARTPGAVLENVGIDENGQPIYDNPEQDDPNVEIPEYQRVEENMRASYPIEFIPYANPAGVGMLPNKFVFLSTEMGVLAPISKLDKNQALNALYRGFTMKMPGTETGVDVPTPTYSPFFGHVFLTLPEEAYGQLFEEYFDQEESELEMYALGTGFQGNNPKRRRGIPETRAIMDAINSGVLRDISWRKNHLGQYVPAESIPGVPDEFLDPFTGWESQEAYYESAEKLIFSSNEHLKQFKGRVPDRILSAGLVLQQPA